MCVSYCISSENKKEGFLVHFVLSSNSRKINAIFFTFEVIIFRFLLVDKKKYTMGTCTHIPKLKVPKQIILIVTYTAADVDPFQDEKNDESGSKMKSRI